MDLTLAARSLALVVAVALSVSVAFEIHDLAGRVAVAVLLVAAVWVTQPDGPPPPDDRTLL